jgi:hypothetical protein
MSNGLTIDVDQSLGERKDDLLSYFRARGEESLEDVTQRFAVSEQRPRSTAINRAVRATREQLVSTIEQKARREAWDNQAILKCVLMTTYASYVSLLDLRNTVWKYEYMAFSRRIGELWEPFCGLCFEYPQVDLSLFIPPLFAEVRHIMTTEIEDYIGRLSLEDEQKAELKRYYATVWALVTSGEIKLELDLHFEKGNQRYNVDFKSGFGSNEKGNTNRLLLVATIYANLDQEYTCILLVRSPEDQNNHYFQTLKNSGIWEAYCGDATYQKIHEFTGFDLKVWISDYVDWRSDLSPATMKHLQDNALDQYLVW